MVVKAEVAGELAAATTKIEGRGRGRWLARETTEKNGLPRRCSRSPEIVTGCALVAHDQVWVDSGVCAMEVVAHLLVR